MVDLLPAERLPAVVHLLASLSDPVASRLANAPPEDEPISEDERHDVEASKDWLASHAPIPNNEVLAELGLTPEDFERMARTPLDSPQPAK